MNNRMLNYDQLLTRYSKGDNDIIETIQPRLYTTLEEAITGAKFSRQEYLFLCTMIIGKCDENESTESIRIRILEVLTNYNLNLYSFMNQISKSAWHLTSDWSLDQLKSLILYTFCVMAVYLFPSVLTNNPGFLMRSIQIIAAFILLTRIWWFLDQKMIKVTAPQLLYFSDAKKAQLLQIINVIDNASIPQLTRMSQCAIPPQVSLPFFWLKSRKECTIKWGKKNTWRSWFLLPDTLQYATTVDQPVTLANIKFSSLYEERRWLKLLSLALPHLQKAQQWLIEHHNIPGLELTRAFMTHLIDDNLMSLHWGHIQEMASLLNNPAVAPIKKELYYADILNQQMETNPVFKVGADPVIQELTVSFWDKVWYSLPRFLGVFLIMGLSGWASYKYVLADYLTIYETYVHEYDVLEKFTSLETKSTNKIGWIILQMLNDYRLSLSDKGSSRTWLRTQQGRDMHRKLLEVLQAFRSGGNWFTDYRVMGALFAGMTTLYLYKQGTGPVQDKVLQTWNMIRTLARNIRHHWDLYKAVVWSVGFAASAFVFYALYQMTKELKEFQAAQHIVPSFNNFHVMFQWAFSKMTDATKVATEPFATLIKKGLQSGVDESTVIKVVQK